MREQKRGVSLIDLLVVILIVFIFLASAVVILNPMKRLAEARDTKRREAVSSILTAVHEYIVDNGGVSPQGISFEEQQLGTAKSSCDSVNCTDPPTLFSCLDLSADLKPYLKEIPFDPKTGTKEMTGYKIVKNDNGAITVSACSPEEAVISVSR